MCDALPPVTVEHSAAGPRLVAGGAPFRFALGNAYYLQEEAARGRLELVDETLSKLAGLGVRVVRAWAFNDDPNKHDSALRLGPDALHEVGLRGLDRLLERARAHGVHLILPLVNYWNAYGGVRQWCLWHGHPEAQEGSPAFFLDGKVVRAFSRHVEALLTRRNPLTGLRYGEDPVVLAWELVNEPRGDGVPQADFLAWVRALGRVVRGNAAQLVSLGEEGMERTLDGYDAAFWRAAGGAHLFAPPAGAAFSRQVELDELDLGSVHFYPEKYGIRSGCEREAGERWIAEHARIAAACGKPLVVGELGLGNEGAPFARFDLAARREVYRAWFEVARRAGVAGIGPWLFAYDARPDAWDDFTWYRRDGLPLDAPQAIIENRYADLVADLAAQLSADPPPSR